MNEEYNVYEEKKKSKLPIALLVLLVIVLTGAVAFLLNDKYEWIKSNKKAKETKTEEKSEKKEDNKKVEESEEEIKNTVSKKTYLQRLLLNEEEEILIDKEGNAYFSILLDEDDEEENSTYKGIASLKKQYKDYKISGYGNKSCGKEGVFTGVKLPINNVVAAYEPSPTQDLIGSYILFIKKDGTVSSLSRYAALENGKIEIENNINNLKNIVTLVQSSTTNSCSANGETIAVDKNGKEFKLNFE